MIIIIIINVNRISVTITKISGRRAKKIRELTGQNSTKIVLHTSAKKALSMENFTKKSSNLTFLSATEIIATKLDCQTSQMCQFNGKKIISPFLA